MTTSVDSTSGTLPHHADEEPPPLWFNVPDGFFALPLAATPEERAERSHEFVRGLYSRGDESIWEPAAPYYEGLAELMAGNGISYSAMGLFSTAEEAEGAAEGEDGGGFEARYEGADGVAQCAFTVAAVPTDQSAKDTDVAAQGILAVLSREPHNDARWLDLPCGPAVSCITLTKYQLSPKVTATGEAVDLLTGQIQVHVPFPTGPFTAIFTLYTASTDYWTEFCDIMAAVLRTVSFTEPSEDEEEAPTDPSSPSADPVSSGSAG
ncbi:hypothetical protein GCM10009837_64240 [Streptomyces durmitorensis]|uniref:Uncharacterized protein n=1 Tax=Streptomyces durmitorensis TaxID=319947 RepID=A0ABY4PTY1_9ACTN|nr:hypothetical protein [Streptomyces durmitorensis]UQT57026.1 hypothetical protein M4V62_19025 [Streptomyces durmitorensis]